MSLEREYSEEKLLKVNKFKKITKLYRDGKYYIVRSLLDDFLSEYPDDDLGWHYYAKLLIIESRYEEALVILDEKNKGNANFMMRLDKIKCFLELERYEEAYILANELIKIVDQEVSKRFLRRAILYSLSRLGQINQNKFRQLGYIEKQIVSYDEKDALRYIHKLDSEHNLFSENIEIETLFSECSLALSNGKKLPNTSTLTDTYLFSYPNVGKDEVGNSIDIVKVATIHNTFDVVSIYPVVEVKNYPANAITLWNKDKEKVLTIGEK